MLFYLASPFAVPIAEDNQVLTLAVNLVYYPEYLEALVQQLGDLQLFHYESNMTFNLNMDILIITYISAFQHLIAIFSDDTRSDDEVFDRETVTFDSDDRDDQMDNNDGERQE